MTTALCDLRDLEVFERTAGSLRCICRGYFGTVLHRVWSGALNVLGQAFVLKGYLKGKHSHLSHVHCATFRPDTC